MQSDRLEIRVLRTTKFLVKEASMCYLKHSYPITWFVQATCYTTQMIKLHQ